MPIESLFIFVLCFGVLGVGLAVYLKDKKSFTARYFFLLVTLITLWIVSNYVSNVSGDYQTALIANRIVMASTTLSIWALYIFTQNYPDRLSLISTKKFFTTLITSLVVLVIDLSPLLVSSIIIKDGYSAIVFGPIGLGFYLLHTGVFLTLYLATLVKKVKNLKGIDKIKLQYFFTGLSISMLGVLITNLVFPVVFNIYMLTNVGPSFLLLLVGFTAFSIVENRLWGLRNLLTQLTYLILVSVLPLSTFYLILFVLEGFRIQPLSPVGIFSIFGLSLTSFVLTSKLSGQVKKYLSGELVISQVDLTKLKDEFSGKISTEMNVGKLNQMTIDVIRDTLLIPDIGIVLLDITSKKIIFEEYEGFRNRKDIAKQLLTFTPFWDQMHAGYILVLDELKHSDLSEAPVLIDKAKNFLEQFNISVMIALNGSAHTHGFILLGPKSNYNAYTSEEIDFLSSIIANNASVAISRALLYERLKTFNKELNQKVEERTQELEVAQANLETRNVQLKSAFRELKTLDDAKSEFISISSHQLRTPISIIRGYVSMLIEGDFGKISADQQVALGKAQDNIQQLNDIVEDILNASRIERGKLVISPEDADLVELVSSVVGQLLPKAERKNLSLKFQSSIESYIAKVDRNKIYEVIMNLVDNAINYTPKGGIEVSCSTTDNRTALLIAIKDSGIGIPADFKEKIFQRFSRSDNAREIRPDGTGIGLYVAKSFIGAHRGEISFKSVMGKGTTFFVKLHKDPHFDFVSPAKKPKK